MSEPLPVIWEHYERVYKLVCLTSIYPNNRPAYVMEDPSTGMNTAFPTDTKGLRPMRDPIEHLQSDCDAWEDAANDWKKQTKRLERKIETAGKILAAHITLESPTWLWNAMHALEYKSEPEGNNAANQRDNDTGSKRDSGI